MKYISLLLFSITVGLHSWAQDIHFSQFYKSSLNLNPALTGSFVGDYRFNANYRNQWASISEPYRTFSASVEANHLIKSVPNLRIGLLIMNDEAGLGGLTNTQINTSFAYLKKLNSDSSLVGKAGVQFGFSSKRINFDRFTFDSQYNGRQFDQTLSNGENFDRNSLSYLNVNTGFGLEYFLEPKKLIEIGISLFNLTNPNQSFEKVSSGLDIRTNIYAKADLDLKKKLDLLPAVLYSTQSAFKELLFGTDLRYHLEKRTLLASSIYGGIWYRTSDAIILTAGLDYFQWNVGLSYDINTSQLQTASQRQGGLELSLTYIFRNYKPTFRRYKVCPNFM
ncbi:MAG: PorP/SprF family type IX secretion system membrane protein [Flavobacteriales bacterium]|nr:PorP/SprF family type IX secretion system membrane protein [Flavobacteriales bacterium]